MFNDGCSASRNTSNNRSLISTFLLNINTFLWNHPIFTLHKQVNKSALPTLPSLNFSCKMALESERCLVVLAVFKTVVSRFNGSGRFDSYPLRQLPRRAKIYHKHTSICGANEVSFEAMFILPSSIFLLLSPHLKYCSSSYPLKTSSINPASQIVFNKVDAF